MLAYSTILGMRLVLMLVNIAKFVAKMIVLPITS